MTTAHDERAAAEALAIEVIGLRRRFGDVVAVDGLDITLATGRCLGLLGPNGAGKTTTINILVGLERADSGTVRVLGQEFTKRTAPEILEQIGVQLQESRLDEKLTVAEVLRLFGSFYRTRRSIDEVLELVGLAEKRNARNGTLSGGQRQRLAVACALVHHPRLLFLDEPTTGLDPQARRHLWQVVTEFRARGGTVLLTTHYMDEAEHLCDDIVIIDHGKAIATGSPRQIIASLGAESLVEIELEGLDGDAASDALERELAALAGVLRVRRDAKMLSLQVGSAHVAVPAILELVKTRGYRLEHLHTHRPTLEDVFVTLTGRHLRDA
ncbi:MAG: ATP-binding cassette domain-containing protein [Planctomycetota bacterium]